MGGAALRSGCVQGTGEHFRQSGKAHSFVGNRRLEDVNLVLNREAVEIGGSREIISLAGVGLGEGCALSQFDCELF
ncbi:hypothetical protein PCS_03315 [Desulfocurvibacter africanus PCS]|uniref:Uncharacterized protein n=1 Tax=Desulfocurvibacter africanus PCS TaxID=1262666 RepID=M5PNR6_DESAF|nr:hypothetical protein PCS_03315 [Desulfocurvibacter africanus PCS]